MEPEMSAPTCAVCKDVLADWFGNVMVPRREYYKSGKIEKLTIICCSCTRDLDERGGNEEWHNIIDLNWVQERFVFVLGMLLSDLTTDQSNDKWSSRAVEDFFRLVRLRFPDLGRSQFAPRLEDCDA